MSYDAAGNMLTRTGPNGSLVFGYDTENRLVSAGTREFGFDADGNRVLASSPEGMIAWLGSEVQLDEVDGQVTMTRRYSASGQLLAERVEEVTTVLPDHLGTAVVAIPEGGEPVQRRFDPWGLPRSANTQAHEAVSRGFTDAPTDPDTDLVWLGSRSYDPGLGRFTQPDTIIPDLGTAASMNRYTYLNNNPQGGTDPGGRSILVGIAVGIAAAIATSVGNSLGTQSGATNPAGPSTAGNASVDPSARAVDPYAVALPRNAANPNAVAIDPIRDLYTAQSFDDSGGSAGFRPAANASLIAAIRVGGGNRTYNFRLPGPDITGNRPIRGVSTRPRIGSAAAGGVSNALLQIVYDSRRADLTLEQRAGRGGLAAASGAASGAIGGGMAGLACGPGAPICMVGLTILFGYGASRFVPTPIANSISEDLDLGGELQ